MCLKFVGLLVTVFITFFLGHNLLPLCQRLYPLVENEEMLEFKGKLCKR
jgi:hypothetical protein